MNATEVMVAKKAKKDKEDAMEGKKRLLTRTIYPHLNELAGELGCSTFHLRAVLRGRRRPGPELAAALAEKGIKTAKLRKPREQWV